MPAMIRANDKIEREREVRGEILDVWDIDHSADPYFYLTKMELRDRLPDALLIEVLTRQITVIDADLTVHEH